MIASTKHELPILDQISVASPCHVPWDEMQGDDRSRYCGQCRKNVFNIAAMTREEATRLIAEREGSLCVRLYRRHDGTLLTGDCPVGNRLVRQRIARAAAAIAAVFVALVTGTLFGGRAPGGSKCSVGGPASTFSGWMNRGHEQFLTGDIMIMGAMAPPKPAPVPPITEHFEVGETILTPEEFSTEAPESPLPEPTPEQIESIHDRLTAP